MQGRLARPELQVIEAQADNLNDTQCGLVQCVSDTYQNLTETRNNLDAILRPVSLELPEQKTQLTEVIVKLKQIIEMARKVCQRLDEQQSL